MLHVAPPEGCRGGVDYVPGIDTEGRPVVPADAGARPVPVPPQIVMPLPNQAGGPDRRGYVVLDGAQIDALVNPPPCRD